MEEIVKQLATKNIIGREEETNHIYVELTNGFYEEIDGFPFIHFENVIENFADKYPNPNVLVLFSVYVPEALRNQGIFTEILQAVEQRATKEGKILYVGPFMTEDSKYIIQTCKHANYHPFPPAGMIKDCAM